MPARRMWRLRLGGCVITSHDTFPPVEAFSILTQRTQREREMRERESEQAQSSAPPPSRSLSLSLNALPPSTIPPPSPLVSLHLNLPVGLPCPLGKLANRWQPCGRSLSRLFMLGRVAADILEVCACDSMCVCSYQSSTLLFISTF